MKDTYTISELADLFNISTPTLRYYDKIGLLKPNSVDVSNKYRIYNRKDFRKLYLIISLKTLGLSLAEIKDYCATKNVEELEETLLKNKARLEQQIAELSKLNKDIDEYLHKIQASRHNYRNVFEVKQLPERNCYRLPFSFRISDLEFYMSVLLNSYTLSTGSQERGALSRIVLTIDRNQLREGQFRIYNGIGFLQDNQGQDQNQHTIPGGEYAVTYHVGEYASIHTSYQKLYDYIAEHGYEIAGESAEISILDVAFTNRPGDYITEIQIPIQKPSK